VDKLLQRGALCSQLSHGFNGRSIRYSQCIKDAGKNHGAGLKLLDLPPQLVKRSAGEHAIDPRSKTSHARLTAATLRNLVHALCLYSTVADGTLALRRRQLSHASVTHLGLRRVGLVSTSARCGPRCGAEGTGLNGRLREGRDMTASRAGRWLLWCGL